MINLFFSKQFISFVVIGGINTLSTAIFASFYTKLLGTMPAFILGYITGIIISYTLNSIITFGEKLEFVRVIKFGIATIPNFIIQTIIVYVGSDIMFFQDTICYIIAAIIGVPITFIVAKLYVFVKD